MFEGKAAAAPPRPRTAANVRPGELPLQHAVVDNRRLLTVPWTLYLQSGLDRKLYIEATHADRIDAGPPQLYPPASYPPGALFWETDRGVLYQSRIIAGEARWVYVGGTMRDTLANKPTDLGLYDTGFLFYGTDYLHTWRWTGVGWEYAPGDRAAGEIAWFYTDPGTGWALANGAAATRTLPDASTASTTTPNLIGAYPKGGSSYTGAVVPATGATVTATAAAAGAHGHGLGTLALGGPTSTAGAAAGGLGLATNIHVHDFTGSLAAVADHTHTITASSGTGGEPAHVDLLPYFRL